MNIEMDMVQTIGFAVILLVIGMWLRRRVRFFERFAIPSPVIGGFLFAIINLGLWLTDVAEIEFDTTLQSLFMTMFFTTVGYGASIAILRKAGPLVLRFLVVASVLVILQDVLATALAPLVQIPSALALMTGSVAMTGGHGVSGGIAPLVEANGTAGAETVAYTAATFGLIAGSLMGGPLANRLITKHRLHAVEGGDKVDEGLLAEEPRHLRSGRVLQAFVVILIAMFIGSYVTEALNYLVGQLTEQAAFPGYFGSMIVAIILRYLSDRQQPEKYHELVPPQEVEVVGEVALALFLAMALMSIRLWELVDLALPLIVLLAAQTVLMFVFARFVTSPVMGKSYDSAIITAGHCGFGMGATPNGVANMESVVQKFTPSPVAFFVLPIVGGMFIDFVNITVIMVFLGFVS